MEPRLVPINAFIALCSAHATSYPNTLNAAGFVLEGMEIPIGTDDGRVVIDGVAFNAQSNVFIAAESKSGNNVEDGQAQRYRKIPPADLVRFIGVDIRTAGDQSVQPVYLCLAASVDRIQIGLEQAGCDYPILAIGVEEIALHNAEHAPDWLRDAFAVPIPVPGPPPSIIRVDDESPDEEFDAIVSAALVAAMSRGEENVSCPELAASAIPHLSLFGKGHRNALIRSVTQAARRACELSPENFDFRAATQQREHAIVKILESPETADPRGRTQRYQSLRSRLGGGAPAEPEGEQPSLFDEFDLAAELEKADTDVSTDDDTEEER